MKNKKTGGRKPFILDESITLNHVKVYGPEFGDYSSYIKKDTIVKFRK